MEEKRASERDEVLFSTRLYSGPAFCLATVRNISEGGALVTIEDPANVLLVQDGVCTIEFLPVNNRSQIVTGHMARIFDLENGHFGVGIRFDRNYAGGIWQDHYVG